MSADRIVALLEPIQNRLKAATLGPWEFDGTEIVNEPDYASMNPEPFTQVMECDVACGSYCYGGTANLTISPENRALIQHAPTDQARLLAAVQAVSSLADAWQARGDHLIQSANEGPNDTIAEALSDDGHDFKHKANLIRSAVEAALGGAA